VSAQGETEAKIRALVAAFPSLGGYLDRVCDHCDRRGGLKGRLTLGRALEDAGELAPLRRAFGGALVVAGDGAVRLSLDRFARDLGDADCGRRFLDALYRVRNREPRDLVSERETLRSRTGQVFDRLALGFPELHEAVARERERHEYWRKQVAARGQEAVQAHLWTVARLTGFLLQSEEPLSPADLGARACQDSKVLGSAGVRSRLARWLAVLVGAEDEHGLSSRQLLERAGVVRNPTAATVLFAGAVRYRSRSGHWFDWPAGLWEQREPAVLTWLNLSGVTVVDCGTDRRRVITCENETPFCGLLEELPEDAVLVYTAGYPNACVRRLVRLFTAAGLELWHWGDSDLDGYRIAPLRLWRCDLAELERNRARLRPMTRRGRERAEGFLREHPGFLFARELSFSLECGWLEQESWGD
jgi:hypothetical protein